MRLAVRALVYLAIPAVGFAWLLELDFSTPIWGSLDSSTFGPNFGPTSLDYLIEALVYTALGAGIAAVVVAVAKLLRVGALSPPRHGIER